MSIECEILEYLKQFPSRTVIQISAGIKQRRYKVVLAVARLMWRQQIKLDGYSSPLNAGQQLPVYSSNLHEKKQQVLSGGIR